ncbi:hypothetical protein [Photobacterium lipolyticum]|uniref:Uncharacterized protein n=1 Tax=Photobacterium lipolyticum TaxID=266810 RepID=A0A2T3MMF4_9GAMM|nr:hypothetical protein [Photobacterium lipolyticum]PSV97696.1 hypothetical protein C9I89_22190 [Photobacterium lipolyticum]
MSSFTFTSKFHQIILSLLVVIVLSIDCYNVWSLFTSEIVFNNIGLFFFTFGVLIKLGILMCLVLKKGPLQLLTFIWGAFFTVSGFFGLLSFLLSFGADPLLVGLHRGLFLLVGIGLLYIATKSIKCENINNQSSQ